MSEGHHVWFTDDGAQLLARAGEHLAQDPVTSTIVSTNARRVAEQGMPDGVPDGWFAVVHDCGGEIAGVAMRTAPFEPYPPYVLAMPDAAAQALAHAVLARDGEVGGVGGSRPAADVFAAAVASATGGSVEVHLHHRLFQLTTLAEPRVVPGRLRVVRREEAELALQWLRQFFLDADEQAGREPGHLKEGAGFELAEVHRRIDAGLLWFWADEQDRPVHLVGANPPAFGTVRIGPVYTPAGERGRGWAAAAVAEVSRRALARGDRPVLFTDQANPTSNALYETLGYEPVVDTVQLDVVRPG